MVPTRMGRQLMVLSEETADNGEMKANAPGEILVLGEARILKIKGEPSPKSEQGQGQGQQRSKQEPTGTAFG